VEVPVDGNAERRAADVLVLVMGWLPLLQPRFCFKQPAIAAEPTEFERRVITRVAALRHS